MITAYCRIVRAGEEAESTEAQSEAKHCEPSSEDAPALTDEEKYACYRLVLTNKVYDHRKLSKKC